MKNDKIILASVLAGYTGEPETGMWSSPCWMAHRAGAELNKRGMTKPTKAAMSRGYSVRLETAASDLIVRFSGDDLAVVDIDRRA